MKRVVGSADAALVFRPSTADGRFPLLDGLALLYGPLAVPMLVMPAGGSTVGGAMLTVVNLLSTRVLERCELSRAEACADHGGRPVVALVLRTGELVARDATRDFMSARGQERVQGSAIRLNAAVRATRVESRPRELVGGSTSPDA